MKTNWKKESYRFSTIVLLDCVSGYFERNPVLSGSLNRESNRKKTFLALW